jgi:hypothetical protein
MGVNGGDPGNYNFLVDALGTLADQNFDPAGPKVAVNYSPRTWRTLTKTVDTLGQPLRKPDVLANTSLLPTNQIGNASTQGTATTASDAFVTDWDELIIGMRMQLQIQIMREIRRHRQHRIHRLDACRHPRRPPPGVRRRPGHPAVTVA